MSGGAAGLLRDLAVRQRPLQFGDARVGEVGAAVEYELLQTCERFEMYQSGISDLGRHEVELLQVAHPLEMYKSRVSDLGATQI